jgi:hypothetical protein
MEIGEVLLRRRQFKYLFPALYLKVLCCTEYPKIPYAAVEKAPRKSVSRKKF